MDPISHLFFADDSIIFPRSTLTELQTIKDFLYQYELTLGQKVNYDKSELSFSHNASSANQIQIIQHMGVKSTEQHSRYLGLPTVMENPKKQVFAMVRDKNFGKLKS